MQEAWQKAEEASQIDIPVLLWGETGTGKDLMAHYIHGRSARAGRPLIKLDCATLPGGLVESELFGYEKGAFTDARYTKRGLVESAHRSTLFLNEVGNIPLSVQAKLLRLVDEKTFRRVGGIRDIEVDFRLISATNRDLRRMIREGSFREDLYFRLHGIEIYLPPLRERREDILPLVDFYLKKYCREYGREVTLSEEARAVLVNYPWPGNVRELGSFVETLLATGAEGVIGPERLPLEMQREAMVETATAEEGYLSLRALEREYIKRVLEKMGYQIKPTARLLGISPNTLRSKMRRYGIAKRG